MSGHYGTGKEDDGLISPRPTSIAMKVAICGIVVMQVATLVVVAYLLTLSTPQATQTSDIETLDVYNALPGHKVAVSHITPRADQAQRGTCWDFATIALLEWSYRANGIKNGWLKPEEYVKLSEQAYGKVVLDRCQQYPVYCVVPNDAVWLNSTDGGEIPFLYSLPDMGNAIVPNAVCPYARNEGHDYECANLPDAMKKGNPIKFRIKKMNTLFEINAIKDHLRRHGRALGFSTAMTNVNYYYPCSGKWARRRECQPVNGLCETFCPLGKFPDTQCCVAVPQPNYNKEAEFYSHGATDFLDGGHAMLLVGFNDNFITQDGSVGGFILKNNWVTNASHSMDYFMQVISRWDEGVICPNSANPRNWYTCETLDRCLSMRTVIYANVSRQPLELKCINENQCRVGDKYTYYIKNYTHVGDDMHSLCFFGHNAETHAGEEICIDPLVLDTITNIFHPKKPFVNDPDRCGFYFFPYKLVEAWWSRFHNSYATDFDIEWDPQSYLANKARYPNLDYRWLETSVMKQRDYEFAGPIPYEYLPKPDEEDIQHVREEYAHRRGPQPALSPKPKPPPLATRQPSRHHYRPGAGQ